MKPVLGFDIGGANLKMAHSNGWARTVPFELWKHLDKLPEMLRELLSTATTHDEIAVTMTGELCDCFETKRQGVHAILDAVATAFPATPVRIWRNDGCFVDMAVARQSPYEVASANWLALATFAGRFAPRGVALLIDIGSTTTDIIPIVEGTPVPKGRTDAARLQSGELVYRGVRRTPITWTLKLGLAAEVFATTLDALLLLDKVAEDSEDLGTADGRPATKACAHSRLSRMFGYDGETCAVTETRELARMALDCFAEELDNGIRRVVAELPSNPHRIITAGTGETLARDVLREICWAPPALTISMSERLGVALSTAACAYAVAVLAAERIDTK